MTDYSSSSYRSDTGLWHLTVTISDHGLSAVLNLKGSDTEPARQLVDCNWPKERAGLMARIENAVYDHPEMLDDYSATIIVESSRTLIVPPSEIKEDSDIERLYTLVYKSHPEDVMEDNNGKETVLFTLAPGMISFLRRTFPGARLRSHLGLMLEEIRSFGSGLRIFVNARNQEADIVALNCDTLLSASVQPWREWSDLAYRIMNLIDVYSLPAKDCEIYIKGATDEVYDALSSFLTENCAAVKRFE